MWPKSNRRKTRRRTRNRNVSSLRKIRNLESLEPRVLMAADPIHVGVVFIETDYLETNVDLGTDAQPDRFLLSFTGGAPGTELTELRIRTDKAGDGLSIGDPIFDTADGGRGKEGNHGFQVLNTESADPVEAIAEVADGGQELVIQLRGFHAGDRLEFSLDVDEALKLSDSLEEFNRKLDVITSGQEFEDSILNASFAAPHFEAATADALFLNDFGDPGTAYGLDLPPDEGLDLQSPPNRTAAAIATAQQIPKPISISGTVWVDDDLDLSREAGEPTLKGVELTLMRFDQADGQYVDTGARATTDSEGRYRFPTSLGLIPGTYRVVQTQPDGYVSVGAVPGRVDARVSGSAAGSDVLTGIELLKGDLHAVEYDFAEAQRASVSGYVYRDDSDDGQRDPGEPGLPGIRVRLVPVDTLGPQAAQTVTTDANGFYQFEDVSPGEYRVVELDQPAGLTDGLDTAGTIDGRTVGQANNPGDQIDGVVLAGNQQGIEYNFGELPLGQLAGMVYLVAPGETCDGYDPGLDSPLPDVRVVLNDELGNFIAETRTDSEGRYFFEDLPKGNYTVLQFTPDGLIDGGAEVGRIRGVQVGEAIDGGRIERIVLPAGGVGTRYDFCELAPATITGSVYHDADDNGRRDGGEAGIEGAEIDLVDASSNAVVATTQTDASGRYRFEGVLPGTYVIREQQPAGYLDGTDAAGTIDGQRVGSADQPGDAIRGVTIRQGQAGVDYDFGELLPAELQGRVHVDTDGDCVWDPGELRLAGVTMRLLDDGGREVATTQTDSNGEYHFDDLVPGVYTVVQTQPEGYFDGGQTAGTAGGDDAGFNRITAIALGSGIVATEYDFCEKPPAEISGRVHVDRDGDGVYDSDEPTLEGVRIDLRDGSGTIVDTTSTDRDGRYRFTSLPAGTYTVEQTQPIDYLQGGQRAGSAGGDASVQDRISTIPIEFGDTLVNYDFYELEPGSISGFVYVDHDADCVFDPGEPPLAGVEIQLLDDRGRILRRTLTDSEGRYRFEDLAPDRYQIREIQPAGYYQGGQVVGSGGGIVLADDHLGQIDVGPNQQLTGYDFCELEGGSLAGRVWSETDRNRSLGSDDERLAGVGIELLDTGGQVVARTTTDANGEYRFQDLAPGTYAVRQIQPDGLFHLTQLAGTLGGDASQANRLTEIEVGGGQDGIEYDFIEFPPATISGFVFQDGPPLQLAEPPEPAQLRSFRDGVRDDDDPPLSGVMLELRQVNGQPFLAENTLPGVYPEGPIRVTTDAAGFYEFAGLRPGSYHVYQVQPEDYIDSLDTPGPNSSDNAAAVNPADLPDDIDLQFIVQTLSASATTDPGTDAILNIDVQAPGFAATENNFSEILVDPLPPPPTPEPPQDPPSLAPPPNVFPGTIRVVGFAVPETVKPPIFFGSEYPVSWHLSVINGGTPRGEWAAAQVRQAAAADDSDFDDQLHRRGRWNLLTRDGQPMEFSDSLQLGDVDAVPLAGDFNGDGRDELAIFVAGQWFIDLNGNGYWDAGDLLVWLGNELDRPVVGDWDGDGKDDVGIFGPQWHGDPRAIVRDPGLPAPANQASTKPKNLPPKLPEATDGVREMRRTREPTRADLIDHVFRYGQHPDTPLAGDWNGDGIDAIAVFRNGVWRLDENGDGRWTSVDREFVFGSPTSKPVVGDWNGDGIDDLGVVEGDVWILDSDGDRQLTERDERIRVPAPGPDALPIAGDFDGDGIDQPGYYQTTDPPAEAESEERVAEAPEEDREAA